MIEILRYGSSTQQLSEEVITRYDGLDNVTQEWVSTLSNLYSVGSSMPSYSNVRITEVLRTRERGDYRYRLNGVGLAESKGTRQEDGYPKITKNLEALDEATDSYISASSNVINIQDTLAGYGNMYCVSATSELIHDGFYRVQGRYLGLISSKPYKRRITVNGQVVNPADPLVVSLPGGWGTPEKGQFQLPKIVISDFRVQVGGPPTSSIPGTMTPPDAPSVSSISFSGMPVTRIWPSGWTIASFDGEYIAGTNVWAGSYVYEYNYSAIPG